MSQEDGSVTLPFADGEYTFRIAIGQWRELQEQINRTRLAMGAPVIGPSELARLLMSVNAWPDDVREVIRLGLIGGGLKSDRALVLIKRHVEGQPFLVNTLLAAKIVHAAIYGPPDDEVGKEPPPPQPETATETDASGLANSTGLVLQ